MCKTEHEEKHFIQFPNIEKNVLKNDVKSALIVQSWK